LDPPLLVVGAFPNQSGAPDAPLPLQGPSTVSNEDRLRVPKDPSPRIFELIVLEEDPFERLQHKPCYIPANFIGPGMVMVTSENRRFVLRWNPNTSQRPGNGGVCGMVLLLPKTSYRQANSGILGGLWASSLKCLF